MTSPSPRTMPHCTPRLLANARRRSSEIRELGRSSNCSPTCLKAAPAACSTVPVSEGKMMEYAVIPANAVTSKKSAVSHAWMLILGRRLCNRLQGLGARSRGRGLGGERRPFSPGGSPAAPFFSLGTRKRSLRSLTEYIPHTPGGVDKLRVPGVALYLLAQMPYVDVHGALVAELVPPHPREQRAARENAARVGGERHQKLELRVREVHVPLAHRHPAARQVYLEPVVGELVLTLPLRDRDAAHDRAHPRHQLAHRERLGHVVVGPELEAHDPVYLVVFGSEHDDGDVALGTDPATHLRPVYLGQHDVE